MDSSQPRAQGKTLIVALTLSVTMITAAALVLWSVPDRESKPREAKRPATTGDHAVFAAAPSAETQRSNIPSRVADLAHPVKDETNVPIAGRWDVRTDTPNPAPKTFANGLEELAYLEKQLPGERAQLEFRARATRYMAKKTVELEKAGGASLDELREKQRIVDANHEAQRKRVEEMERRIAELRSDAGKDGVVDPPASGEPTPPAQ